MNCLLALFNNKETESISAESDPFEEKKFEVCSIMLIILTYCWLYLFNIM